MNILEKADDVTKHARQSSYGHPFDNHGNTAKLWEAYLDRRYGLKNPIDALDVCYMMILLKVSRLANEAGQIDSLVDIAGYARNAEMILDELGLSNE
jgi:hypothetical protein